MTELVGDSSKVSLRIKLDCNEVLEQDLVWEMRLLASDDDGGDCEVVLEEISVGPFVETGEYKFDFNAALPNGFISNASERVLLVTRAYQDVQLAEFTCLLTFG